MRGWVAKRHFSYYGGLSQGEYLNIRLILTIDLAEQILVGKLAT